MGGSGGGASGPPRKMKNREIHQVGLLRRNDVIHILVSIVLPEITPISMEHIRHLGTMRLQLLDRGNLAFVWGVFRDGLGFFELLLLFLGNVVGNLWVLSDICSSCFFLEMFCGQTADLNLDRMGRRTS